MMFVHFQFATLGKIAKSRAVAIFRDLKAGGGGGGGGASAAIRPRKLILCLRDLMWIDVFIQPRVVPVPTLVQFHRPNHPLHQRKCHHKCPKYHHLMVLHRFSIKVAAAARVKLLNDTKHFDYLEILLQAFHLTCSVKPKNYVATRIPPSNTKMQLPRLKTANKFYNCFDPTIISNDQ